MEVLDITRIDLLKVGNLIQICGGIYSGEGKTYLCLFPGNELDKEIVELKMSVPEWTAFLKQGDLADTEVSIMENGQLVKAILRKSARYIDSNTSWAVYRRDGYKCRYCGNPSCPLTVDHIDLWEDGGATIIDNLLSACRSCNKERGNILYEDWIVSSEYQKISVNLSEEEKQANLDIVSRLDYLKTLRVKNIKSR